MFTTFIEMQYVNVLKLLNIFKKCTFGEKYFLLKLVCILINQIAVF